ncbi:uncharacterized protein LOC144174834 isoform X2 [Haemaphysalis longicornis]
MVKRKDRTGRRQILQLKEERRQPHQTKNVPSGLALPSLAQEENDDSDGADETAVGNEPASKNGVQRDAIDDQLADFMKEIDAISTPAPGTEDPEGSEQKSEPTEKEPTATTSGSAPVPQAAPEKAGTCEPVSIGNIVAVPPPPPPPVEGEVPPCPWVECIDESTGYTYFWHQVTNEVTWDCPPEYEAYWAQYGEPVEGSAVNHDASVAAHDAAPGTAAAASAAAAEPTSSSVSKSTAAAASKAVPGGTAFLDAEAVAASALPTKTAKSMKTEQPSVTAGLSGTSRLAASAKKKRKQETAIGAIIPITSYGASDSSSSEDSDYERHVVQRASSRKYAAKRSKASSSMKQPKRGSSPLVVYGPQLPGSLLDQPEPLVYGPQLPDAPDTTEAVVYGPQLPTETGSTEEKVYGPHLPDATSLEPEPEPPVMIGPQLPESQEDTAPATATISKVFIGPQLPEGFLEKKGEPCDTEEPVVCEDPPSLEPARCSPEPMEVDEHKANPKTAITNQCAATAQESESPSPSVEEEPTASKRNEPAAAASASALAGLVDYPGSPVADGEDDDKMDVQDEAAKAKAPGSDQDSVNYPVMTGGKLQFESAVQGASDVDGPKDAALSSPGAKGSVVSQAPASSPATSVQSKVKHSTHSKKKSQHLVSYGDSESSDEDSVEVDVTAESPAAAATHERSDPTWAAPSETEDDSRHPGLGSSRMAPLEEPECAAKPQSKTLPFVQVNFVRSAEVLVLSECVDVGAETKGEAEKESEKETEVETEKTRKEKESEEVVERLSPHSDRTAGTRERSASPAERKAPEDSDVDDFDDVVRALDIALLESKKKAEEDVTKPTTSPKREREASRSPCDTSEEEGEIKSSESSSEEETPPAPLRKSRAKKEPEAVEDKVPAKRKRVSRSETPSPTPDQKADELRVKIGEAYQLLMDKLNPLRDVVSCRNTYFELVVQTTTRMEDWRAGVLEAGYFLQKLRDACDAASQLHHLVARAQKEASPVPEDSGQGPLPPGWQRHWDSGHSRYFYVQEETGHAQWTFPTATATTSNSPDSTAQAAALRNSQSESTAAAAHSPPASSPPTAQKAGGASGELRSSNPGGAGDLSPEPTATREGGAEGSTKQDDSSSLDAAEAAFYSSVALSAEPVIAAAPQAAQEAKPPVPAVPTPTEEAAAPAAPAPKKKKTKVAAGLTLRKKNIPTLLQKWEKIKEEQKRGMPS